MEFTKAELYLLLNQQKPLYLRKADLSGANLIGANLRGAHLSNADLRGANLSDAYLINAKYNKDTKWPDRFDPIKTGAVLVP